MAGLMYLAGFPEDHPHKIHSSQADNSASVQAAIGTVIALKVKRAEISFTRESAGGDSTARYIVEVRRVWPSIPNNAADGDEFQVSSPLVEPGCQ